jgi:hypothetical protein
MARLQTRRQVIQQKSLANIEGAASAAAASVCKPFWDRPKPQRIAAAARPPRARAADIQAHCQSVIQLSDKFSCEHIISSYAASEWLGLETWEKLTNLDTP